VLIAGNGVVTFIEAVGCHDGTTMAVIVPDVESGGLLVRACLNNAPNSVAATMAIALVLRYLPPVAAEVLNASIGSGFVSTSVKKCAASLHRDRGTLRRHLQNTDRTLVPRDIIDLTKATYAIILLRTTGLSNRAVARAVGFTATTSLSHLLERIFGLSPHRVRETLTTEAIEIYLEILLAAWMPRSVVRRTPTVQPDQWSHQ
jgi:methylphosphotriester-DNA--protein-cysteine methyltransferase